MWPSCGLTIDAISFWISFRDSIGVGHNDCSGNNLLQHGKFP
ncbi:hypothetical protein AB4089_22310 [Arthrobacter sp. 2MCAF15]